MIENKPINTRIEELDVKLDLLLESNKSKEKPTKFKMPFGFNMKAKNAAKKDKVMAIILKSNRAAIPTVLKVDEGSVHFNDAMRRCNPEDIWLWMGKYPLIIIPDWRTTPLTPKEINAEDQSAFDQKIMIKSLQKENAELTPKKKMATGTMLILGVVVVVVIYLFVGGGI